MLKLGLHSLTEIIHYAIRHKIVSVPGAPEKNRKRRVTTELNGHWLLPAIRTRFAVGQAPQIDVDLQSGATRRVREGMQ